MDIKILFPNVDELLKCEGIVSDREIHVVARVDDYPEFGCDCALIRLSRRPDGSARMDYESLDDCTTRFSRRQYMVDAGSKRLGENWPWTRIGTYEVPSKLNIELACKFTRFSHMPDTRAACALSDWDDTEGSGWMDNFCGLVVA